VASHQIEFEQLYPNPGSLSSFFSVYISRLLLTVSRSWHEHDPEELISSVEECIERACSDFQSSGHSLSDIKAVGITNQRETTVLWDSQTGEHLYNAIVWTDTRSTSIVHELKARPGLDELTPSCGLPLSTYPSSTKLLWLLRHDHKVKSAYKDGRLAFGTVDTWLVYKLNGGQSKNIFVTEPTNASRTMWMNLHTLEYDEKLISFFGLDTKKLHLPKIIPSSHPDGYGQLARGRLKGVKIKGVLGDQSAALVGHCAFSPGRAKNTYGTGCFLLYNVGDKPVISQHGLLATVAYDFRSQNIPPAYALEGSIAVAGSSVKFLANNLGLIQSSDQVGALAASVPDNGGCVFVTAFSGLYAPYWINDARGTIFGITAHTQRGHIARATLEATCFQTKAILDAMEKDSGHSLAELAVDGGMSNSDLCMQTQADLIQIPVDRPTSEPPLSFL
jgi:glycerol kinase